MTLERSLSAAAWGIVGFLIPGLFVIDASVSARATSRGDRLEVVAAHSTARRVLAAEFEATENARRGDPASVLVASLGEERLLGGIALLPPTDERIGFAYLVAGSENIPDGLYDLHVASSGVSVDLVDAAGRVVVTVPLDLPFDASTTDPDDRWQRTFLTIARWLGPKLR